MINKVIPFSEMFEWVFGIILLALVFANAKEINTIVSGFSAALTSGVKAVQK